MVGLALIMLRVHEAATRGSVMNGRDVPKFQNDLKDERRRAQMAAARQVLERSTMMLLTSSKTCLRHPECPSARENRDTVFCQMRRAMDLIHYVVKDGVLDCSESQSYSNSQVGKIINIAETE